MSKHVYGSLTSLQDACRDYCFERETFGAALAEQSETFRASNEQERLAVDTAVRQGVLMLAQEKPEHREKAMRRFMSRARHNTEHELSRVCGFGFILTALLSWLIGKALDWLWRYWRDNHEGAALICGMGS